MAILDDFVPNTTLKTVRNGGTTVYSANALYSALKDFEDDTANMTHETIMTAQTPTEYSFVNSWYLDNESAKYLNGGAITTIGYLNNIQRVVTTDANTDPISTDIGKQVNDGGDVGALLHYDLDINNDGTQVNAWYVRTGAGTALTGALTITGGTGAQTVSTSVDGEEVWANIFHLGTIVSNPAPQFYVIQASERIAEWSGNSNFSRGNLDVLIRTQVEGTLIDSGNLLVTIRQQGDSYDSFEVTAPSGRNPIPLNSATDADNLSAEYYVLYDAQSTAFVLGEVINGQTSGATFEVVSDVDNGTTGVLGLRNLNEIAGTLTDNENLRSGVTVRAVLNGTKGDRVIAYDAEGGNFTVGLVATDTSGAKGVIRGLQDDGTTGLLLTEVNHDYRATGGSVYYDLFTENDTITDTSTGTATVDLATTNLQLAVSGFDDIDVVFHHGEITVDGGHTLTEGMHVTQATTNQTGIITSVVGNVIGIGNTSSDFATSANSINDDDSGGTGANPTTWVDDHTVSKAFSQASSKNYDVVIFLNNRTVSQGYEYGKFITGDASTFSMEQYNLDVAGTNLVRTPVDGQEYLTAYIDLNNSSNTYTKTEKRSAPLGNFAGGTWFTARGIWLQDVASADATAYQLIDSDNVVQNPPNFITITMSNTVSGDSVMIAEDDGTGLVKKDTYTSHNTNNGIGTSAWDTDGTPTIRTDTPASGYLRVVDTSSTSGQVREHRYKYASFTGDVFTLTAITDSTGTAGTGGLTHTNSGRDFGADGVEVGMMVRNVTSGDIGFIATVGTTTFTVKQLEGAGDGQFDTSDVVEINKLVVAYDNTDTGFVPYIDTVATTTSVTATVIYSADRNLVGKTRNKGVIFAFDGTGSLTNTGGPITTVRTADTIAV